MSSPVNRTALREEENRPAPASQQVSASAVTGPRHQLGGQHFRAHQVPGGAAAAARSAATPCSVRSAPAPSAGAPWWKNTAQLHPGGVLAAQVVIGLQQRPALQDLRRRIQHPGSRPSASSTLRCRESVLSVWHAACGRGRRRCRPARPHARRSRPRPATRRHTATRCPPPPRTRRRRSRRTAPARPQVRPVGRGDLAALHLPGHCVEIVEGQLLPVDIQPAYDG